jgi:hypothetical protein
VVTSGCSRSSIYELDLSACSNDQPKFLTNPNVSILPRVLQTGAKITRATCAYKFSPNAGKTLALQISTRQGSVGRSFDSRNDRRDGSRLFLITLRDISAVKENEKLRSGYDEPQVA